MLILRHLESYPMPLEVELADCFTVGVIGDWNLGGQAIQLIGSAFDLLLTDLNGCEKLRGLGFENVRYVALWGYKPAIHRCLPDVKRDLDVVMIGNFNTSVQRQRARWIARVAQLASSRLVCLTDGVFGDDYTRMLNRAKIVFNHSIRGEMNARAFEAPACGALMFYERENRELAEFLTPGQECVLYSDEDLERLLEYYLDHDDERLKMAQAGRQRVQGRTYPEDVLERMLSAARAGLQDRPPTGRPAFRQLAPYERLDRFCDQWIATSLWPRALWTILKEAAERAPADPVVGLRLACLAMTPLPGLTPAVARASGLLNQVLAIDPENVAAAVSLARLGEGLDEREPWLSRAAELLESSLRPEQVRGPYLRHGSWQTLDVEIEAVYCNHVFGSAEWLDAMRSVLAWFVTDGLAAAALDRGATERASELAAKALQFRNIGSTRLHRARALRALGKLQLAADEYQQSLRDEPLSRDAWIELLTLLAELGQVAEFEVGFRAAANIARACPPFADWLPALERLTPPNGS